MLTSNPCVTYNVKRQMFSSGGSYKDRGAYMNLKT